MSRIGKKVITLPKEVVVKIENGSVLVKGPKGECNRQLPEMVEIKMEENTLTVVRADDSRTARAMHGLTRTLIQNMVTGVTEGFNKDLILHGVGYRMEIKGKYLVLNLGYSHPIYFQIPEGIKMEATQPVSNTSELKIWGINKEAVGLIADKIRSLKKPEPYLLKGFKYRNEVIIKKAGKTGK